MGAQDVVRTVFATNVAISALLSHKSRLLCEVWRISKLTPFVRDPNDRKFLELAAVGGATLLVTGDPLALGGRTPFVTPAELRERLGYDEA